MLVATCRAELDQEAEGTQKSRRVHVAVAFREPPNKPVEVLARNGRRCERQDEYTVRITAGYGWAGRLTRLSAAVLTVVGSRGEVLGIARAPARPRRPGS